MTVPNVLATRYASPAMRDLWSPEHKIVAERRLWLAVIEALRDLGVDFGGADPDAVLVGHGAVRDLVERLRAQAADTHPDASGGDRA